MTAIQTARYTLLRGSRRAQPHWQRIVRFTTHRPCLAISIYLGLLLFLFVEWFHWCAHGVMGRWYYNYALTKTHPALVWFIPKGGWSAPTDPPRWIPEIFEGRWPGDWDPPVLTRPVWKSEEAVMREYEAQMEVDMRAGISAHGEGAGEEEKIVKSSPHPLFHSDAAATKGSHRHPETGHGNIGGAVGTKASAKTSEAQKAADQGEDDKSPSLGDMAEQQRLDDIDDLPREKVPAIGRRSRLPPPPPIFRRATTSLPSSHPHTLSRRLSSPAIIKFHIFSAAVSEGSYAKRQLIRRLSPMYQIPPEYRHLIDIKFVMGYNFLDTWGLPLNETMERRIREEQREYGDILRLPGLWRGENLRDGKIMQWIRDVGQGKDGRDAWYLFKVDEDAVINLPKLLDLLLSLNIRTPTYLGTSLARWPGYHNHFTGFLSGFNYGLLKTLSDGISRMPTQEVQAAWDDDVLTGELMYSLPSAPHCLAHSHDHCDPHRVPRFGWQPLPENPDPRTDLDRVDFVRTAGDPAWFATKGDLGMHGWWFKFNEYWEKEWHRAIEGKMWDPPAWIREFADTAF